MQTIHIEPDELRNLSHLFEIQARVMLDEDMRLRQAGSQLDMAWQGGNAGDFLNEMQSVENHFRERIQELYNLSRRLNREADRWEESDQTWVLEIRKILGFINNAKG